MRWKTEISLTNFVEELRVGTLGKPGVPVFHFVNSGEAAFGREQLPRPEIFQGVEICLAPHSTVHDTFPSPKSTFER